MGEGAGNPLSDTDEDKKKPCSPLDNLRLGRQAGPNTLCSSPTMSKKRISQKEIEK